MTVRLPRAGPLENQEIEHVTRLDATAYRTTQKRAQSDEEVESSPAGAEEDTGFAKGPSPKRLRATLAV